MTTESEDVADTLAEKLARPTLSTGRARCNTKQLRERFGICEPLDAAGAIVITGHQREKWVQVARDVWELDAVTKL